MADESLITGFKKFILRGNVVDLAVAVVIGMVFGKVVAAVVTGLIDPLIQAIFGQPNIMDVLGFTINKAHFSIGVILDALINFLAVAAVVYFLVVVPLNKLLARFASGEETVDTPDPQLALLAEIRDLLAGAPIE